MAVKKEKAKKAETKKVVKKVSKKPKVVESKSANIDSGKPRQDEGKQKIIDQFSTHKGDTGSPEVQVAILTWKVVKLQEHMETNQKDNHSRRGLLKIISKRRRIMKYLKNKDEVRYNTLETKIKEYQNTK